MVGLCGAVAVDECVLGGLAADLASHGTEQTRTVVEDDVALAVVGHPGTRAAVDDAGADADADFDADGDGGAAPGAETETDAGADARGQRLHTTADGSVTVLLWGDVWGDEVDGEYARVDAPAATYCAERYDAVGRAFLSGLNGNFAGALYDRDRRRFLLFTDRLGTRPIHHFRTASGLVFTTSIQSLPLHPAVDTGFDEDLLAEYFALKRCFGITTPLRGVEIVHPAAAFELDLDDGTTTTARYWEPRYDPVDADAGELSRRLAATMRTVVADRTAAHRSAADPTEIGLLLSGGSDSRLVLAAFDAIDQPVRAYHLNEWRNREARIAERAAAAVGADFTLLERDADYQARAARSASRLSNFVGYFNQHHAGGFADRLRRECDVLFTGHYGDMLFKGNHLRTPTVDLGPVGSFDLPYERPITGVDDFVSDRVEPAPDYLDTARAVRDVYAEHVSGAGADGSAGSATGRPLVDHGVEYPSLREATLCSRYPLTNGTSQFFYHATAQMLPAGTPFLDNRLVDLFLTIPVAQLKRGDLINRATAVLSPGLADLPHGRELLPIRYPFALNWPTELVLDLVNTHLTYQPGATHWTDGPWPDHGALVRDHSFVRETIDANEALIRDLPFLDWDGVNRCYEAHLRGDDRVKALYTLVTFLNMPVVERLHGADQSPGPDEADGRPVAGAAGDSEALPPEDARFEGADASGSGSY